MTRIYRSASDVGTSYTDLTDADDVQTVIKSPSRPEFGEVEFFVQNDDGSNNLSVRVQQRIKAGDSEKTSDWRTEAEHQTLQPSDDPWAVRIEHLSSGEHRIQVKAKSGTVSASAYGTSAAGRAA